MQLSLRSILPLTLSGVLALIGLWWYTSRKKDDDTSDEPSSQHSSESDKNRNKVGQEILSTSRTLPSAKQAAPPVSPSQPEKDVAEEYARPEQATAAPAAGPPTVRGGGSTAADLFPGTAAEAAAQGQQGPAGALPGKNQLFSNEDQVSGCDPGSGTSLTSGEDIEVKLKPTLLSGSQDSPGGVFSTKRHVAGERPDPEGEVAGGDLAEGKTTVRFADLPENCLLSSEVCPVMSGAESVCGAGSMEPQSSPGAPCSDYASAKEMQQLAEGLIADMVSAAVAEVLRGKAEMEGDSLDCIPADAATERLRDPTLQGQQEERSQLAQTSSSSIPPLDSSGPGTLQTARQVVVDDSSSTSSSQSEDSSSDDEQLEVPQDLRSTRRQPEVLSNGHRTEERQLTQGLGLPSMTAHCEQGADSQVSSSQPGLSSQPSTQTTEPATIWEIEVPKHLVGRMIGKQGRYVSYLEKTSGATVYINTVPYTQDVQICHIEGTKEQVESALDLIRMKFKELELTNCYAQPPVLSLPSLPITSWLLMPHGVTVEVKVVQVASGNYLFLQQHTHPTFHALHVLDQQMALCYSHPGCPTLPAPVEIGVICAAQMPEGVWWRAQVMRFMEETREVEIRYVDYGGYHTVSIENLRQIRSDFVSLPFQGSEVILENITPVSGEEANAKTALEDLTQGVSLLAQVTEFHTSGIPLVQIWRKEENQLVSVNQALVERGVCSWINRP